MRLVRRISRLAALVLGVVLANASLAGSGYACMPSAGASMRMGGMTDGMPAASKHHAAPAGAASSHETAPDRAPCQLPMAPDVCANMAPCAPIALPSASIVTATVRPIVHRVTDLTIAMVPGDVRAPEPPPPRA